MVSVLIPIALGVCGTLAAALTLNFDAVITGAFAFETLHIVGYVGGQLFLSILIGLLIQEAVVPLAPQMRPQPFRRKAASIWLTMQLKPLH